MSEVQTCPRGHRWEPPEGDAVDRTDLICPYCSDDYAVPPPPRGPAPAARAMGRRLADSGAKTAPHGPPRLPLHESLPAVPGYEILGELGRGGMGVVYKARQVALKRVVALKMILGGAGADAEHLARMRVEAEAAARLSHPGIVQVYEVGEHEGRPFLALEYVEGGSLDKQLAGTPLPARRAAELVEALARAMHYAHERGVVHRDLKPANVLIQGPTVREGAVPSAAGALPDGRAFDVAPKIADFGLAKRLDADTAHTQTGAILGTPSYMAPEQASGLAREANPLVDVYALGAILYECLTGRPPFRAATTLETLEQVRRDDPVSPSRLQPGLPRDVQTICLRCLQKVPTRRYGSAGELGDDLRRFLDGEPIRARPVGAPERLWKWAKRRPATASLIAAGVVSASLFVAGLLWHQGALRREVARANANKALMLTNFRKAHAMLDDIFTKLELDTFRVEDKRAQWLRREVASSTLFYYHDVLRDVNDPDPDMRLCRAQVLVYAGRLQHLFNNQNDARRDYAEANRLLSALVEEFPDNDDYRREWATCLYRQACQTRAHDQEKGKEAFHRVVRVVTPLIDERAPAAKDRELMGLAYYQLASLHLHRQTREAVGFAQGSAVYWAWLVKDHPENTEYRLRLVTTRRELLVANYYLTRREEFPHILRRAEETMKPALEAAQPHLNDLLGLAQLASMYQISGTSLWHAGQNEAALALLDKGVKVMAKVLKHEPAHKASRVDMGMLEFNRALALETLGRRADALKAYDAAVAFSVTDAPGKHAENMMRVNRAGALQRLGELDRAVAEVKALSAKEAMVPPTRWELMLVACRAMADVSADMRLDAGGRARRLDELASLAMACLDRCQKEGHFKDPKNVNTLRSFSALDPLRGRPEFRKWLAELEKK